MPYQAYSSLALFSSFFVALVSQFFLLVKEECYIPDINSFVLAVKKKKMIFSFFYFVFFLIKAIEKRKIWKNFFDKKNGLTTDAVGVIGGLRNGLHIAGSENH